MSLDHFRITAPFYTQDPEYLEMASNKIYGFWFYLMSDCVLFATLFATFVIFRNSSPLLLQDKSALFDLHNTMMETTCLLTSSFTYGLAIYALKSNTKKLLLFWLTLTFLLGTIFICLEFHEFYHLIENGNGPTKNAFISSFFTLVGTHGLHVIVGLIWMGVMIVQVFSKGLILLVSTRLILLSLFWHFLDLIWICIFTFVYLAGYK